MPGKIIDCIQDIHFAKVDVDNKKITGSADLATVYGCHGEAPFSSTYTRVYKNYYLGTRNPITGMYNAFKITDGPFRNIPWHYDTKEELDDIKAFCRQCAITKAFDLEINSILQQKF